MAMFDRRCESCKTMKDAKSQPKIEEWMDAEALRTIS